MLRHCGGPGHGPPHTFNSEGRSVRKDVMIGPMDEIGSERAPMGKAMVVHGFIESTVVIAKAA